MNATETRKKLPGKGSSILAALLAAVLTVSLLAAVLSILGIYALTSEDLHIRSALSKEAVALQMERIRKNVTGIGTEYGFDPEEIIRSITRESVEDLDRSVVAWWTGFSRKAELTEKPVYSLDGAEDLLRADQKFMESLDPMTEHLTIENITRKIGEKVVGSAVLFRDTLLSAGIEIAGKSVNLQEILTVMGRVPRIAGALSLLLAGLIALVMSRRILTAGHYIGGALSACSLLVLLSLILIHGLNLGGMIREASAILSAQFEHLAGELRLEWIGTAVALMAAGAVLMILARKEYGRDGQ